MKSNTNTIKLVEELKKLSLEKKAPFWKRIAKELEKPTRNAREVNVYKLDKYAKEGETIFVPGKILGTGEINKKINVIGLKFSNSAIEKLNKSGSKIITIQEAIKKYPDGKKMRIIG